MLTQRQLFLLNTAQTSGSPRMLEIDRAEGMYIFDTAGKKYMDLVSGFAVSNIGHRHPEVIQAIKDQADRYLHITVYGEYVQAPQTALAGRLCGILPPGLNSVYFVNSGAEATEGAMKLAKRFTGRSGFVAFKNAYHGSSQGALSLMGNEYYKQAYRPLLPDVRFPDFDSEQQLNAITEQTAAVIIEPVQGEAGIRVPDSAYMKALRQRCSETGAMLIFDEIQTGFGRTGKLFAFEHFGIVPDILLLAKGMGGGMPIGAFIAGKPIMDCLKENPVLGHITTFGGHPVSCAAALATLEVLLRDRPYETAAGKEALFRSLLIHPAIGEVRGMGLMLSIQLQTAVQTETVSKKCAEAGVLTDWFLHCDTALRIAPPLIISEEEIRAACAVILSALN